MKYVLPFDLYEDWKELMFAKEVAENIVEELKMWREVAILKKEIHGGR